MLPTPLQKPNSLFTLCFKAFQRFIKIKNKGEKWMN